MSKLVHDMTTVGEEAILNALAFLMQRLKIVVEPSAAVALAPLLSNSYRLYGKRIGILLSGGNVDISKLPISFHNDGKMA
jgi:threonine dehydratase